ncbi:hypothetical protein [Lentilactobacillus farraginis]|uniref:Integral membrane protein n=1 Tax=Lentilactobacillus farraginis DSM 18382 = JCM 14108 TaxID=1423743 RepID=X0PHK6_9LACO|nr:hypothetical protein [Lentilactobacillus farraginis]KRM12181.1 hypothetical protein FD41_GL000536 [Lentilactobacillus farraginis DSM 18382 = JCM 14108]GAF36527.1 hypothetical protein JCM14108_1497 [Lentilactobacillus farraginis DSM 18382 = JCM 14108]
MALAIDIFITIYALLTMAATVMHLFSKDISLLLVVALFLSAFITLTSLMIVSRILSLDTLLLGLVGISIFTFANGYYLYGRPHWSHHLIRLALHVAIFIIALMAW